VPFGDAEDLNFFMTSPSDSAVSAHQASPPLRWLGQRVWSSAWTLLFLTNLFWAGNIIR
jgi:hypothetical protein